MCFDELADQGKAYDGSAACTFLAFVSVIDGVRHKLLLESMEVIE